MQLRHQDSEVINGNVVDIYVYCEDDGKIVCFEASHFFSDIINSDSFMVAELKMYAPETMVVRDQRDQGRLYWKLLSRTRHDLNTAGDVIPITPSS